MLDYRLETFLTLCDKMNYRITAETLLMTQPAVTQHIHHLEKEYGEKLFVYQDKKLRQTSAGKALELYARSASYNEKRFREKLEMPKVTEVRIGATKTIGDYVLNEMLAKLVADDTIELMVVVENTQSLLKKLKLREIDIAVIEGFFDKDDFDFELFKEEKLVGICAKGSKFAEKSVKIEELFDEKLILREKGSGTRQVLAQALWSKNFNIESFKKRSFISSFELIKKFVADGFGVSFVYESIAKSDTRLDTFSIENLEISHEFNYVFLKNTTAYEIIDLIEGG